LTKIITISAFIEVNENIISTSPKTYSLDPKSQAQIVPYISTNTGMDARPKGKLKLRMLEAGRASETGRPTITTRFNLLILL